MNINNDIVLVDNILSLHKEKLGEDYSAYRNHVYRVIHFCYLIKPDCNDEDKEKIVIVACFHDLGIWLEGHLNYLSPSIELARAYLTEVERDSWFEEIALMINFHHKLRRYKDTRYPLVEIFRQADWVDVSLGKIKFTVTEDEIKSVKAHFANAGFHKKLNQLTIRELLRHPFKPLPMMKW